MPIAFLLLCALIFFVSLPSVQGWKPLTVTAATTESQCIDFVSGALAPDYLVTVGAVVRYPAEHMNRDLVMRHGSAYRYMQHAVNHSDSEADLFAAGYMARLSMDQHEYDILYPVAVELLENWGELYDHSLNTSLEIASFALDSLTYAQYPRVTEKYLASIHHIPRPIFEKMRHAFDIPDDHQRMMKDAYLYSLIHRYGFEGFYLNRKFGTHLAEDDWDSILDEAKELLEAHNISVGTLASVSAGDSEGIASIYPRACAGSTLSEKRHTAPGFLHLFWKQTFLGGGFMLMLIIGLVHLFSKRGKRKRWFLPDAFRRIPIGAKLLFIFIIYMHFEGFLKLLSGYHPLLHGFKYFFAAAFLFIAIIWYRPKGFSALDVAILLYGLVIFFQLWNPLMQEGQGMLLSFIGAVWYLGFIPLLYICRELFRSQYVMHIIFKLVIALSSFSGLVAYLQHLTGYGYLKIMYSPVMRERINNAAHHGPLAFDVIPPVYWYITALVFIMYFITQYLNRHPIHIPRECSSLSTFFSTHKKLLMMGIIFIHLITSVWLGGYRLAILIAFASVVTYWALHVAYLRRTQSRLFPSALIAGSFLLMLLFLGSTLGYLVISDRMQEKYDTMMSPLSSYLEERGFTWLHSAEMTLRYPAGTGLRGALRLDPARFGVSSVSDVHIIDNYVATTVAEAGIAGLLGLLFVFAHLVILFIRIIRMHLAKDGRAAETSSSHHQVFSKTAASGTLLTLFILTTAYFETPLTFMFWILAGVLLSCCSLPHVFTRPRWLKSLRAKSIFPLILLLLILPSSAHAWKPYTHIYLASEAGIEDSAGLSGSLLPDIAQMSSPWSQSLHNAAGPHTHSSEYYSSLRNKSRNDHARLLGYMHHVWIDPLESELAERIAIKFDRHYPEYSRRLARFNRDPMWILTDVAGHAVDFHLIARHPYIKELYLDAILEPIPAQYIETLPYHPQATRRNFVLNGLLFATMHEYDIQHHFFNRLYGTHLDKLFWGRLMYTMQELCAEDMDIFFESLTTNLSFPIKPCYEVGGFPVTRKDREKNTSIYNECLVSGRAVELDRSSMNARNASIPSPGTGLPAQPADLVQAYFRYAGRYGYLRYALICILILFVSALLLRSTIRTRIRIHEESYRYRPEDER